MKTDAFHLQCKNAVSYKKCVHALGGDVRPSASKCGAPSGFKPTPYVGAACCEAMFNPAVDAAKAGALSTPGKPGAVVPPVKPGAFSPH